MENLLERLASAVESGKALRDSPYPADLVGQDGAAELCRQALDNAIPPDMILKSGLVVGMRRIGDAFGEGRVFVPQILLAASWSRFGIPKGKAAWSLSSPAIGARSRAWPGLPMGVGSLRVPWTAACASGDPTGIRRAWCFPAA